MQYGFNTIMISAVNCFPKKTPSLICDTVMNTPVVFIVDFAWSFGLSSRILSGNLEQAFAVDVSWRGA